MPGGVGEHLKQLLSGSSIRRETETGWRLSAVIVASSSVFLAASVAALCLWTLPEPFVMAR
jgi:hypothetical protein